MKRIMILGGGTCQKNAILAAKERGLETLVADYSPEAPGVALSDFYCQASTFDWEACEEAAREYRVDGIMTMGTDQPVLTAALVSQALNLPSQITVDQARALTNKRQMKELFREKNIPTVPYRFVGRNTDFKELREFPGSVVLKPLDSQGQRGVYRLKDPIEAGEYLEKTLSYSREEEALLEAYYPSDEITVSGWACKGELTLLAVTDRLLREDPVNIGVCTSHRFPTIHRELEEEIRTLSQQVSDAFQLENGPLYIQLLAGEEGVVVNEAAFRIGGAFEDVLIPKVFGFDILQGVISAALGERIEEPPKGYNCFLTGARGSVQLMFANPGQIASVTPLEELRSMEDVLDAGYNFKEGQWVPSVEDATARFGHCVFFKARGDLEPSLEAFRNTFKILDKEGKNLYQRTE